MAKKGKGAKKKQNKEDKKDTLPEVDKEYYEIQIADLNKKLSRLRKNLSEMEKENDELKTNYKTLDQDRADIIAYLKRTLGQKTDEIKDVTRRLLAVQQEKESERRSSDIKTADLQKRYDQMQGSLTAEIKLLNGKLNSLEEFKNNKDELMNNLNQLQMALEEQRGEHEKKLRDAENHFIIMRDKMRHEIEERLLKLALDLQRDAQGLIAETTKHVVKENIAINNELNLIINSWQKLFNENEELKRSTGTMQLQVEVSSEVKDKLLNKNLIQERVIEKLSDQQSKIMDEYSAFKQYQISSEVSQKKYEECIQNVQNAVHKANEVQIVYHAVASENGKLKTIIEKLKYHNYKLEEKIKDAVGVISEVIELQHQKTVHGYSDEYEYTARKNLLASLLKLFEDNTLLQTEPVKTPDPQQSNESILASDWMKISTSKVDEEEDDALIENYLSNLN